MPDLDPITAARHARAKAMQQAAGAAQLSAARAPVPEVEQKIGGAGSNTTEGVLDDANPESAASQRVYAQTGHYATGSGILKGLGTSTSDSIPAMLSTGEAVLNAGAAQAMGDSNIRRLNTAFLPKGAKTCVQGGVLKAAAGDTDIQNTINQATGIDKGNVRPSLPLPAAQAAAQTVPEQITIPDVSPERAAYNPSPEQEIKDVAYPSAEKPIPQGATADAINRTTGVYKGTEKPYRPMSKEAADFAAVTDETQKPFTVNSKGVVNTNPVEAPGFLTKAATAGSGILKGAAIGEGLQTAHNAIYNALPKSAIGNTLNAGVAALSGDTENAAKMFTGQEANTLSPGLAMAKEGYKKIGDAIGFKDSRVGKLVGSEPTTAEAPTLVQPDTEKTHILPEQKALPSSPTAGNFSSEANAKTPLTQPLTNNPAPVAADNQPFAPTGNTRTFKHTDSTQGGKEHDVTENVYDIGGTSTDASGGHGSIGSSKKLSDVQVANMRKILGSKAAGVLASAPNATSQAAAGTPTGALTPDQRRAEQVKIVDDRIAARKAHEAQETPIQQPQQQVAPQIADDSAAVNRYLQTLGEDRPTNSFDAQIAYKHRMQNAKAGLEGVLANQRGRNESLSNAARLAEEQNQHRATNQLEQSRLAQGLQVHKDASEANALERSYQRQHGDELFKQGEAKLALEEKREADKPKPITIDGKTAYVTDAERPRALAEENQRIAGEKFDADPANKASFFGKSAEEIAAAREKAIAPKVERTADTDLAAIKAAQASGKYTPEQIEKAKAEHSKLYSAQQ